MPQKESRARTSAATSVKAAGAPGVPNRAAPRRSPRLLSLLEDSGGATTRSPRLSSLGGAGEAGPAGGDGATPCGRSSRIGPSVDCCSGAGPADGVARIPCRGSARLLSQGGHGGGIAGPPDSKREGGHSARSRRQASQISGLRRSLRLAKSAMDSGGPSYADATGGGDPEGDCRRKSAVRSRGSILKGLTGKIENGSGSDETGGNLGWERKVTKKDVFEIPTERVSKGPGRPEVESAVSKESGADVDVDKRKKRMEISVVPVTAGRRDKKWKQKTETQEELVLEGRDIDGGSGCPEWTNEQEIAIHRAYILAKPSPHFWKKVAKLVPGKSAQQCFDKMHSKIATPVPIQPRSRSETIDCCPLGSSDLLKKGTRRSKRSKRKSLLLAHKTARHILRKHSIMDQGQEADLFSVLETSPNIHAVLSQIKMPWSPGCIAASPQLPQRSIENLSPGHKKAHSRFKSQVPVSYVSPEVLKPVKNIVLHEKYIDELHCREARRRMCNKTACSVGAEDDDKENVIAKDDIVKAAKNALVSEAKGIMCLLRNSQSSPSSNSEDTCECEDECEEDTRICKHSSQLSQVQEFTSSTHNVDEPTARQSIAIMNV